MTQINWYDEIISSIENISDEEYEEKFKNKITEYMEKNKIKDINSLKIVNIYSSEINILEYIIKYRYFKEFKILVEQFNADITIKNKNNDTLLHICSSRDIPFLDLAIYLLDKNKIDINALNNRNESVLSLHYFYNLDAIKLLINHGADPNIEARYISDYAMKYILDFYIFEIQRYSIGQDYIKFLISVGARRSLTDEQITNNIRWQFIIDCEQEYQAQQNQRNTMKSAAKKSATKKTTE